jgi:hypothetical protein
MRRLDFVSIMTDNEGADFIAALSKTADMVELLLRQIDLLIFAHESGRKLTDAELEQLHDHQKIWRRDLERRASVMIEPPTRVQ